MLTASLPATPLQNKAAQNIKLVHTSLRFAAQGDDMQPAADEQSSLLNHENATSSGGDEVHLRQNQPDANAETSSNRASASEDTRPESAETTTEEQLKRLKDNRSWWQRIIILGATYDYLHTATNIFDKKPWKTIVLQAAIYAVPSAFAFYKRRTYGQKLKEMQRHSPSESA